MKTIARGMLVTSVILGLIFPAAVSAADFYAGKTIRYIVGFAAGGGYDAYTRNVGRYIGRYIPGNPSTVVENMEGAGSVIAANYTYNKASRDGLTVGSAKNSAAGTFRSPCGPTIVKVASRATSAGAVSDG